MEVTEFLPSLTGTRTAWVPFSDQLEQRDGSLLLTKNWTTDLNYVVEVFELDRSIDAQVGSGAVR